MRIKNQQKGFTIVELLVVIVVIAILIAFTLPNLFGLQKRARDDQRKNDLKVIGSALETYYNDKESYPGPDATAVATALGAAPVYLSPMPVDPKGGATYAIASTTAAGAACTTAANNCQKWDVRAVLENTADPDANTNATAGAATKSCAGITTSVAVGTYCIKSINQ